MSDTEKQWASALGRIASGLFILTARRGAQETGMLASWVQQCSFDPPLVMAAVRRGRVLEAWLHPGDRFVLNILDDTQTDMIVFFGRGIAPGENVFGTLPLERTTDGTAVLSESLAYLDCIVEAIYPSGDHEIMVGKVAGGRMLGGGHPMVHIRKSGLHY
jgi:flavin reductase (DIM6/NTAB) family NADH-FMN oxidoreductase RutF